MEFVAKHEERLATERREMEASDVRAKALEVSIQQIERAHEMVAARDTDLKVMSERIEVLEQLATRSASGGNAGRRVEVVEVLKQDLMRVDEMARRATWQMESLKAARADLEELRAD